MRKLSKMTNKLSKSMLDVVGVATGSVMAPLVKSQAGKTFFSMAPGEVLLASLDAVSKLLKPKFNLLISISGYFIISLFTTYR